MHSAGAHVLVAAYHASLFSPLVQRVVPQLHGTVAIDALPSVVLHAAGAHALVAAPHASFVPLVQIAVPQLQGTVVIAALPSAVLQAAIQPPPTQL